LQLIECKRIAKRFFSFCQVLPKNFLFYFSFYNSFDRKDIKTKNKRGIRLIPNKVDMQTDASKTK
jgi:hypothetical protein